MLSREDRAILDFERSWFLKPGPKDRAIEFGLGLTSRAYYEALRFLISDPLALEYDPLTVRRLRSMVIDWSEQEMAI